MRAFVTGGTGFIGSHLIEALLKNGHFTVGLIRDHQMTVSALCDSWVDGDLSSITSLERVLSEYEIDTVFHLAAQSQFACAVRDPVGTFEANIRGTWNLLEACRRQKVNRSIVSSSDKAHGRSSTPYTEDTPLTPDRPYETSKACVDLLVRTYASTYGMNAASTRFVNIYGPGDLNMNRLIPNTIRRILKGEPPIIRNGSVMKRDFLYIDDAIDGYVKLANSQYVGPMCFGTGESISIESVVRQIMDIMRCSNSAIQIESDMQGEIIEQSSTYNLAHRVLGWKPTTSLDEGLKKTIEWYREFLK